MTKIEPDPAYSERASSEGACAGPGPATPSMAGAAIGEAAISAAQGGSPFSPRRWGMALLGAAGLAAMAAAFVLAGQSPEEEPSGPFAGGSSGGGYSGSSGAGHPAGTSAAAPLPGARRHSDVDKFGAPRAPLAAAPDTGGCGQLDPDNPPVVEFVLEGGKLRMGDLKQGVKVEREVTFRSAGTGPLCVIKVTTGCGCMKAKLIGEKRRFEPGEEGRILVAIDTTGRVGSIRKQVTLTTNDANVPLKSFRVEMRVNAGLLAEPRYLQFGSVVPGTTISRYLILRTTKDDADWKVTGVEGARDVPGRGRTAYAYEVERVEDPRYHKYKLKITHPGREVLGPMRDIVRVLTTHPERPKIEVSAHINIVPRILSRSRVISLGFVRPASPRPPMRARIQPGVAGIEFEITKVEIQPREGNSVPAGGLGFVATYGQDARGWWVDVAYDGKTRKPGLLQAILVLYTDDTLQPEVRVPIRATIRSTR